jgi:hypothetical protein
VLRFGNLAVFDLQSKRELDRPGGRLHHANEPDLTGNGVRNVDLERCRDVACVLPQPFADFEDFRVFRKA